MPSLDWGLITDRTHPPHRVMVQKKAEEIPKWEVLGNALMKPIDLLSNGAVSNSSAISYGAVNSSAVAASSSSLAASGAISAASVLSVSIVARASNEQSSNSCNGEEILHNSLFV